MKLNIILEIVVNENPTYCDSDCRWTGGYYCELFNVNLWEGENESDLHRCKECMRAVVVK